MTTSLTLPSSRLGHGGSSLAPFLAGGVATAGAGGSWLFADGHQEVLFRSVSSSFCRLWLRFTGVMGTKHELPHFVCIASRPAGFVHEWMWDRVFSFVGCFDTDYAHCIAASYVSGCVTSGSYQDHEWRWVILWRVAA